MNTARHTPSALPFTALIAKNDKHPRRSPPRTNVVYACHAHSLNPQRRVLLRAGWSAVVLPYMIPASLLSSARATEAGQCEESRGEALAEAGRLYEAGRLEEAEEALTFAAEACDVVDARALKLLGDVRADRGRYSAAVEAYDASLSADPTGIAAAAALFGRASAFEGLGVYEAAVDDFTASLALVRAALPLFERAQAQKALRRWREAEADYSEAAALFVSDRRKREGKISEAQAAFSDFEMGNFIRARTRLETLSRQLYSSDVRAALVAVYWREGEAARAESLWLDTCTRMEGASCGLYSDRGWVLSVRQWTPRLADSMADFLAIRVSGGPSRQ